MAVNEAGVKITKLLKALINHTDCGLKMIESEKTV